MLAVASSGDPLPFGYYTLLRIVVCSASTLIAFAGLKDGKQWWPSLFAFVAILFNPIEAITLSRNDWLLIDVWAALAFGAHGALVRLGLPVKG